MDTDSEQWAENSTQPLESSGLCWSLLSSSNWNQLCKYFLKDLEQMAKCLEIFKLVSNRHNAEKEASNCKLCILNMIWWYQHDAVQGSMKLPDNVYLPESVFVSSQRTSWPHYLAKTCSCFLSWPFGSLVSWTGLWALVKAIHFSGCNLIGRHNTQHCIITVYILTYMLWGLDRWLLPVFTLCAYIIWNITQLWVSVDGWEVSFMHQRDCPTCVSRWVSFAYLSQVLTSIASGFMCKGK